MMTDAGPAYPAQRISALAFIFVLRTALTGFEFRIGFADHVNPATTLYDLAVAVTILCFFQ